MHQIKPDLEYGGHEFCVGSVRRSEAFEIRRTSNSPRRVLAFDGAPAAAADRDGLFRMEDSGFFQSHSSLTRRLIGASKASC